MLPADVFARFQRAGATRRSTFAPPTSTARRQNSPPLEAGQDVARLLRRAAPIFRRRLGERFGLSWDHFGRSSSPQNRALTQDFARALWQSGPSGSAHHAAGLFQCREALPARPLRDRHLSAIAAMTARAATSARTARACSIRPISSIRARRCPDRADIEIRDSAHLFLKQSEFVPQLARMDRRPQGRLAAAGHSIANKWLDEGLQDRGITRDLEWGVPVPDDIGDGKLKGKVFYVWFDAPIEYIGATKEWADAHGKGDVVEDWWWSDAKDVQLCRIHGQGQCAVSHSRLSRDDHGLRRRRGNWWTRSRASTG